MAADGALDMTTEKAALAFPTKSLRRLLVGGSAPAGTGALIDRLLALMQVPGTQAGASTGPCPVTAHRGFEPVDVSRAMTATGGNLAGSPTADLALMMVDARHGLVSPVLQHSFAAALQGASQVILVIDHMDQVDFSQRAFTSMVEVYEQAAAQIGFRWIRAIPVASASGDNLVRRSGRMPWFAGGTLLDEIEAAPLAPSLTEAPFRFAAGGASFRIGTAAAVTGRVIGGRIALGDPVVVAETGQAARVTGIRAQDGEQASASAGEALTLVLDAEVAEGRLLVCPDARPHVADQVQAHILWLDSEPLLPGRRYRLQTQGDEVVATVTALRYAMSDDSLSHEAVRLLPAGRIGVCNLSLARPIAFDASCDSRATGNGVLLDRVSGQPVGVALLDFPLRRAANIHWQATSLTKQDRAHLKGQRPAVLWFTGLSGSGKSTLANRVEALLHAEGCHTYLLDGDNVRHGLNRDLGFTAEDRVENIRRVAEVARLMTDAGLIVLAAFISPFAAERQMARDLMEPGEFIEIFVDTPIEECARRDPKGLYRKAAAGELRNFTGLDSPYEKPLSPDLRIETNGHDPDEGARQIVRYLLDRG